MVLCGCFADCCVSAFHLKVATVVTATNCTAFVTRCLSHIPSISKKTTNADLFSHKSYIRAGMTHVCILFKEFAIFIIHPSSTAHLESGHRGSSLSRDLFGHHPAHTVHAEGGSMLPLWAVIRSPGAPPGLAPGGILVTRVQARESEIHVCLSS